MSDLLVRRSGPLHGKMTAPGDKSITHRAIILAALARGTTRIAGWVPAEVCKATLRCMRGLGVVVDEATDGDAGADLVVHGCGLHGLREPEDVLQCAGSGTTIRLLAGVLAGQPFCSVLTGSEALRRRPMARVVEPLRRMGATVLGRDGGRLAPLTICGGRLVGIDYAMPVASAQVKSAILLAGLFAEGRTRVSEPGPSRDHTERMLRWFGVPVSCENGTVELTGGQPPIARPEALHVPGDFSSAAFPLVAAAIVRGSEIEVAHVGLNATRTGLLDLLLAMKAHVHVAAEGQGSQRETPDSGAGEPIGRVSVRGGPLVATEAAGELIVRAIDEFPVFAVAATQAAGTTVVREASELRVKESDRIATVAAELRTMGAQIEERPDGMVLHGPTRLTGATVACHSDHRLAMALAVAGLVAEGETCIRGAESIDDSFPGFVEVMQALGAELRWAS